MSEALLKEILGQGGAWALIALAVVVFLRTVMPRWIERNAQRQIAELAMFERQLQAQQSLFQQALHDQQAAFAESLKSLQATFREELGAMREMAERKAGMIRQRMEELEKTVGELAEKDHE